MMIRTVSLGIALAVGSTIFFASDLSAESDGAAIVQERQSLMRTMGKSFGPLIPVLKGESTDLVVAAAAAQNINDAITKIITLFPEGTAKGEVDGTRAKPKIWRDTAGFQASAQALIDASAGLVVAANSGDIDTFKAAFGPLGQACGGCHEGKPGDGGKFRFPK
jgi:cytochrome c556